MTMDELRGVYQGKTILVTGHNGFKGTWLTKILVMAGAKVVGFSLPPADHRIHFEELEFGDMFVDLTGDIRDPGEVKAVMLAYHPDFVFHLAAQPLVFESYKDPAETFAVNSQGTVNVLEAMKSLNKPCICIFITSDKVYRNREWCWPYRETDELGGYDPYSASKACAELAIRSYAESYFMKPCSSIRIGVARAGNVIGGGDWSVNRLIPDFFRSVYSKEQLVIRNPMATRPWQHVLDPLCGYLKLGECLSQRQLRDYCYNFGPDNAEVKSVNDTIMTLNHFIDDPVSIRSEESTVLEAGLLSLSSDRARAVLGWAPKLSFNTALKLTAEFYISQRNGFSLNQVTERQITNFFDR